MYGGLQIKLKKYLLITILLLLAVRVSQAQAVQDTVPTPDPYHVLLKSLLVPGWGQINQDRLPEAVLLYFSALHFYYNAFFNYYHYQKSGNSNQYQKFKWQLTAGLFVHLINVIDAADSGFRLKVKGWQGGLLADRPLKSPWGAALRSAMFPGWGQVYTETYWKAAAFLAVDGYFAYKAHRADLDYRRTHETRYRDLRSKYIWYFGAAYLLTMADAYANAYLFKFDEAIRLTVGPTWQNEVWGVMLNVRF